MISRSIIVILKTREQHENFFLISGTLKQGVKGNENESTTTT